MIWKFIDVINFLRRNFVYLILEMIKLEKIESHQFKQRISRCKSLDYKNKQCSLPLLQNIYRNQSRVKKSKSTLTIKTYLAQKKNNHQRILQSISKQSKQILRKQHKQCKNVNKIKKKPINPTRLLHLFADNFLKKTFIENPHDNNFRLKQSIVPNICMDGQFPMARFGATMSYYDNKLFLYGGFNRFQNKVFPLAVKSIDQPYWKYASNKFRQNTSQSELPDTDHSIEVYKHYLLIIGGKRYLKDTNHVLNNSHIHIYNCQSQIWEQPILWNKTVKSHASTGYGDVILIDGGIDQNNNRTYRSHFLLLNERKMSNSNTILWDYEKMLNNRTNKNKTPYKGLANHSLCNTYHYCLQTRSQLSIDGIISFGGQNSMGQLNNQLRILKIINPLVYFEMRIKPKWEIVETLGIPPQPRKSHKMEQFTQSNLVIITGGINDKFEFLNDIWILNLKNAEWSQIQQNNVKLTCKFPLCSASFRQSLYIFGGGQQKFENSLKKYSLKEVFRTQKQIKTLKPIQNETNKINSFLTSLLLPNS